MLNNIVTTATSNAPQIGRKRRLSSSDREDSFKKPRGIENTVDEGDEDASLSAGADTTPLANGTSPSAPVNEVTEGVKEVELEGENVKDATVEEGRTTPPDSQFDGDAKSENTDSKDDASAPSEGTTTTTSSPKGKKPKSSATNKPDSKVSTTVPPKDTDPPTSRKSSAPSKKSGSGPKDTSVSAPKKRSTAPRSKKPAKAVDTKEVDGQEVV
jgi:hypothetical protein